MKAKPNAEELAVYLNECRIGTLARLKGGKLQFAYAENYQTGIPLSYSMPIADRIHEDATVSPFLWNLLPEDIRLLATWGRQYQVNPSNAFALLKEIGDDCAGAIRFISHDRIDDASRGGLTPISESEIGQRLSKLESDPAAARSLNDEGRFSLAGAQAKIALRLEGDSWHIPWGHEPTTHILKPPRSDLAGHAENEHFCLKLASALGMRAAQTSVQSFAGSKAIVVKRFDRMLHQDKLYRVHQEDMCQALAVGPADKYESDGGPGVTDIMQIVSGSQRRLEDRNALINAVVFNYLILDTDAHAKNYSILHTAEGFILAPLYDIASFAPYVKSPKDERLSMRIDRYYKTAQIRQRHFERMARSCNYPAKKLLANLETLALAIPAACDQVGATAIAEGLNPAFIEELVSTLKTRSQRALDTIVTAS